MATFANDITADRTVLLTAPQTIWKLIFSDANPATAGSWILFSTSATNVLTLSGPSPTITVDGLGMSKAAVMNAFIAGSAGLVKDGMGLLTLAQDNTYTGGTTIKAGTLRITSTEQLEGATSIAAGATLNWQLTNSTQTLANALTGNGILQVDTLGISSTNSATASGLSGFAGTVRVSVPTGATGSKLQISGGAANASLVVDSGAQFSATNVGTYKSLSLVGTGNNETRGALRIPSTITVTNGVTLAGNATIGTEGGTLIGSIQGSAVTTATQTLTFGSTNSTGNMTIIGAISDGTAGGTLTVTKTQAGTLTLSGNNTYTGATTVSAGRVNPTGSNVSEFTIANGGTIGSSSSGSLNSLILNAGASIALAGGTSLGGITANTVNIAGGTSLTLDNPALVGKTYTVLNYTGSLTGFSNIRPLATGHSTITDTGSAVTLTYLGVGTTSTWNSTSGTWDLASTNWTNSLDNKFGNGDAVVFNEPSAPSTITISGVVSPSSVTINNSTNAYTIDGNIGLGATLYKTGSGTVTLGGATFSEGITLSQGSIDGSAGTISGIVLLGDSNTGSNNLTFSQNSSFFGSKILVSPLGTGTVTLASSGSSPSPAYIGTVTLNRPTTFSYSGTDRLHFNAQITGDVGTLTIAGGKRISFGGTTNNFQGDLLITGNGTILQTGVNTAGETIPNWSNVQIDSGAQLLMAATVTTTETINALNGTGSVSISPTTNTTNTLILGSHNGNGTFNGTMSNGDADSILAVSKNGSGTQTLAPAASFTYTGRTSANGGILALSFGGSVTTNLIGAASPLTLGGGTLQLTGANTATQNLAGLTTTASTGSRILVGANKSLTLGALTSVGANSAVNFNTAAGGANAVSSTLGTSLINLTGQTPGSVINKSFTVTDSTGFGLATVDASNNIVRLTTTTLLPASGAAAPTDYRINNNDAPGAAGGYTLTVSASQSAGSITVDTRTLSGKLTLNSGVTLSNNVWNFGGTNTNTYNIIGGTGITSLASADTIAFNNYNTGNVTITSPIIANGVNPAVFAGTGKTILAGTNTYTGATTISGGTVQVGAGATLDGNASTGSINSVSTVTINSGAKLIYNRAGQTNILAGSGAVEYYGRNNGTTSGASDNVNLNDNSTAFTGTMLISGLRANITTPADLGSATITVLPTGQVHATSMTLANNFVISGTGWGELNHVFGALRLDGTIVSGSVTLAGDARIGTTNTTGVISGIIGETGGSWKLQIGGGSAATYLTTIRLGGANTYTGGTDIGSSTSTATTVTVANDLAFGTGPVNVLSDASLGVLSGPYTLANAFTLAAGKTLSLSSDFTFSPLTLTGNISGPGSLTHTANSAVLAGSNTYLGTTTITGGVLTFTKPTALYNNDTSKWTATNLIVNSGATAAFNVGGAGEFTEANLNTLVAMSTATGGFKSGAILGIDTSNAGGTVTIAAPIANPNGGANVLGLTKLGTGTLVLTGANTYTGPTAVDGGTLRVEGSLQTAGTSIRTVTTLDVAGSIMSSGSMLVANGATLLMRSGSTVTLGGGFDIGGIAGTQKLMIEAGATLNMNNALTIGQVPNVFRVDGQLNSSGSFSIPSSLSGTINLTGSGTISVNTGSIASTNTTSTLNVDMPGGSLNFAGLLSLTGAGFSSENIRLVNGTLNAAGGIKMDGSGSLVNHSLSLDGGRLNVGAAGITSTGVGTRYLVFNNGTIGASANWSTALDAALGSNEGTTFNTLDSVDNTTARTITLSGTLSGVGKLIKDGTGTLNLSNTGNHPYAGTTTVNAGTMIVAGKLANNSAASILIAAPDDSIIGNPVLTRAIAAGLNTYAGYGSTVTVASLDPVLTVPLQTSASILMSGNNAATNNMTMQWRTRTVAEATPANPNAVLSDVLSLTDMGNDIFVLQMSYTDAVLTNMNLNESSIVLSGELRLGWKNGTNWVTAVDGNTFGSSTFAGVTPWLTYYNNLSNFDDGSDLASFLGTYGVDPAANTVWAVLNHNSEFAVIPEPSTLVLGGLAVLGFASVGLRKRRLVKFLNRNA